MPQLYLFYDPTCELCLRFKQWVEERDRAGHIALLPLAGEWQERFPQVDFERARQHLTACDARGATYEGLAALRQVARRLPGLARLEWIYQLPGVQQMAGGVYRTVNRLRRSFCRRCGRSWPPARRRGAGRGR